MNTLLEKFNACRPYTVLILRLVLAWRLLAGTWPYVTRAKSVQEIIDFFVSLSIPVSQVTAYVSLYGQFVCGILFALGWLTRPAAMVMFINFSVAILAAHLHESIVNSFQAWVLWAVSIHFFFHGAGTISIDKLIDWMNFKSLEIKIGEL